MSNFDELSQMHRVAHLYYMDNLLQSEIALKEGISRPQVSRILKKARDAGVVEIRIHQPVAQHELGLHTAVKQRFSLSDVVIMPSLESDKRSFNEVFSVAAAMYLSEELTKYRRVGIGWGWTLFNISKVYPACSNRREIQFLPLVSNSGQTHRNLQTTMIVDRIAEQYSNSQIIYLNQPLYRKKYEPLNDMMRNIRSMWDRLDAAVFSVGAPPPEGTDIRKYLEELTCNFLQDRADSPRIIGDIIGRFILTDNTCLAAPKGQEITAIALDQLQRVPTAYCIASNPQKAEILRYAAEHKYYNVLITDTPTAEALLALD